MATDADWPRPCPRPLAINVAESRAILYELLTIERARLMVAVQIEQERKIVFPETTVIIRDIEHLVEALTEEAPKQESALQLPKGRTWRPAKQG